MLIRRVSPNQSNAAPLIGARAKNLQAASARHRSPGAARRRRQRQAHIPLPTSTSSPTRSTPGLSAQFLRTHHRRVRRGSSSYAAGFSGIRCTSLASAATYAFVAAAAGQRDDGARCRGDRLLQYMVRKKILECEDVILEHLKLRKNEDFKLVYFGHSLGGLMAQDCASRSKRRIRVICYGTNRKNVTI